MGHATVTRLMRVCCISDLHGRLPDDVDACDLLLIAGDISAHSREDNERFLRRDFPNWLERQPAEEIVGIAGNHDFVAKQWPSIFRSLPWHYLDNQVIEISGLRIAGSAWTPRFGFWAFMADEDELARIWNQMPDDIDVLLTHGPPFGLCDLTAEGVHAGSTSLRERLMELDRLTLHVFGHIHEAHGADVISTGAIVVNCSLMDDRYAMVNTPTVVELGPLDDNNEREG
jgi:Icc-related predicted phosphoesterase